ncbi:MAG: thioredoxin family protein [Eubacteriales bacterium]
MALLNDEIRTNLEEVFGKMKKEVTIALFTKEDGCETCKDTLDFMKEIEEVGEKIKLEEYDVEKDSKKAEELKVEMTPSIVLLDSEGKDQGIKFYGIPAGHEINSLITGLIEVSGAGEEIPAALKERIAKIQNPVDIKVFVTLGCPHCPGAVAKAHKLALENPNINAQMIEAQTFSELSDKYDVSGVPKIVINEEHDLVGNQPIEKFLETIESI